MLNILFPEAFSKYSGLRILGIVADGFDDWLAEQGYTFGSRRNMIVMLPRIEENLLQHGVGSLDEVSQAQLHTCWNDLIRVFPTLAGSVRALGAYLSTRGLLKTGQPETMTRAAHHIDAYAAFLKTVRGFSASTLNHHLATSTAFLVHIKIEEDSDRLRNLTASDLERFVKKCGQRLSRASLQHTVAELRGFLRFLGARGETRPGLENQIDTPRVYRGEQLPRALPWETVRAFLQSIDRSSRRGLRDYTMFLLMATYGLRSVEVRTLTLDQIDWRAGKISIPQTKNSAVLELPLTDEVGAALFQYLKQVPPQPGYRHLFLRLRAPIGTLRKAAVTQAFHTWSARSGLNIPFYGPHCIRHSYAVYLLKKGTPLKTIGDLLGHRSAESTSMYLRLAMEDLREVALPVPKTRGGRKEVRP
jgi:integrase/recombinase XerD